MKAVITTDLIFIIVVIGLIVGASMVIFWRWMQTQEKVANEYNCKLKLQSYCEALINGEKPKWNKIPPKEGCEDYGVAEPNEKECRSLFSLNQGT